MLEKYSELDNLGILPGEYQEAPIEDSGDIGIEELRDLIKIFRNSKYLPAVELLVESANVPLSKDQLEKVFRDEGFSLGIWRIQSGINSMLNRSGLNISLQVASYRESKMYHFARKNTGLNRKKAKDSDTNDDPEVVTLVD